MDSSCWRRTKTNWRNYILCCFKHCCYFIFFSTFLYVHSHTLWHFLLSSIYYSFLTATTTNIVLQNINEFGIVTCISFHLFLLHYRLWFFYYPVCVHYECNLSICILFVFTTQTTNNYDLLNIYSQHLLANIKSSTKHYLNKTKILSRL